MKTQLVFLETFPSEKSKSRSLFPDPETTLVIYDRVLEKVSAEFRSWLRAYPHRYGVRSGEKLKDLSAFPKHASRLAEVAQSIPARSLTVLAVGGGSIGDFAGFFASVYKRGVRLIHIPSTWLAAIDSSHGGKTALNLDKAKNQIGTFYPAEKVILIRKLLFAQPEERILDGMGELGKIALIDGGSWVSSLLRTKLKGADLIWEFLASAIESKMKVVDQDPREEKGLRQILNLGHTVGHVLEAAHGWSHGYAVAQGLFFAIEFSERKEILSESAALRSRQILSEKLGLNPVSKDHSLPGAKFQSLLLKDKKQDSEGQVTFIFLKSIGKPVRVNVSFHEILHEAHRQGWIK